MWVFRCEIPGNGKVGRWRDRRACRRAGVRGEFSRSLRLGRFVAGCDVELRPCLGWNCRRACSGHIYRFFPIANSVDTPRTYIVRVWHPELATMEEPTRKTVDAQKPGRVQVVWQLPLKPERSVRRAPTADRAGRY